MSGATGRKKKVGVSLQKETVEFYNRVVECLNLRGVKVTLSKVINTVLRELVSRVEVKKFVEAFLKNTYTSNGFSYIHKRLERRYGRVKSGEGARDLLHIGLAIDKDVVKWFDTVVSEIKSVLPGVSRSIVINTYLDWIRIKHNKRVCDILYNKLK